MEVYNSHAVPCYFSSLQSFRSEGWRNNKVLQGNYSHEEYETEGRFLNDENFVFLSPPSDYAIQ